MRKEGIQAVELQGVSVVDQDGDHVTPLIHGKECAFVIFEHGIAKCAIEIAYQKGEITFQKPISCHLYPVRLNHYKDFETVNYHSWDICNAALDLGVKQDISVYQFLAVPLVRKFGKEWYEQLSYAASHMANGFQTSQKDTK
jgi:hypothetical protein